MTAPVEGMGPGTRRLRPVIAIDGPAGAGKSTLAAYLARRFGFLNLETGAMYRALALKATEVAAVLGEEPALGDQAVMSRLTETTEIVLEPRTGASNRVLLDGRDVTERIRAKDIAEAASQVSVHPRVRAWMVHRQRALGAQGGVVMEGRDIGTQVFPDAEIKIFLDADDVVRGQRRFLQNTGHGTRRADATSTEADVLAEVRERDARDKGRATSPLQAAADAVHLDSSSLTLDEVCAKAEALVIAKLGAGVE